MPQTLSMHISYKWLSKWITETGPYSRLMLRSRGRVICSCQSCFRLDRKVSTCSMISSEGDQSRKCLSLLRETLLVGIGLGRPRQKVVMSFLDLLNSICVVVASVATSISYSA
jgi:hypothetical protein